jgi:hypothetical protein
LDLYGSDAPLHHPPDGMIPQFKRLAISVDQWLPSDSQPQRFEQIIRISRMRHH